jgi:hypothetical protein
MYLFHTHTHTHTHIYKEGSVDSKSKCLDLLQIMALNLNCNQWSWLITNNSRIRLLYVPILTNIRRQNILQTNVRNLQITFVYAFHLKEFV